MMIEVPQPVASQERSLAQHEQATICDDRFVALVGRQSRFVFRIAYSILRNVTDSEDVVQETFLKVYRARNWESIENEKAFLARIAWRVALDRLPKVHKNVAHFDVPSSRENPEQAIIIADWNATVHRLIDALPEKLRLPLALSTVEELNSHEIAEVMGIATGTVRTRLMRARQILKQKLATLMAGPHGK